MKGVEEIMNISGKMNIFVAIKKVTKDGKEIEVKDLTTSIGKKNEDGTYSNMVMEVSLIGEKDSKNDKAKKKMDESHYYPVDVSKGWIGFRIYMDKDKNVRYVPQLIVSECSYDSPIELKKKPTKKDKATKKNSKDTNESVVADDDLPF